MAAAGTPVERPLVADIVLPCLAQGPDLVTRELVTAVVYRLMRPALRPAAGAVLVDARRTGDVAEDRRLHRVLFTAVWEEFAARCAEVGPSDISVIKEAVTRDGVIPPEDYGSRWSFKALHTDRDAMLFSHLYGPVRGFRGGELLLVDARALMQASGLLFDDAFEWSVEPTAGSKPVLREGLADMAVTDFGVNLGAPRPGQILFVNNAYGAGILHGVTPVTVVDPAGFVREYHRCSGRP